MSEKFNDPNKKENNSSQEKHELEEDLYGRVKYLFEKEHEKYGKNYPEVGWISELTDGGSKLKITKVFEKDGDPYIEYFYIYDNEEEKEGKEDRKEKNLESPEKASEEIVKKVEETNEEIKKNVEEHKGLEGESSAGVEISGADKLEEKREEIVRKSKDRLDGLTKREGIVGDKNELYDNIKHLFLNKYGDSLPKVGWEIDHEGEKKIITRVYERDKKLYVWYKEEGLKEESKENKSENISLDESLEMIEKNLDKQPKSVQDLFDKMKDKFIRKETIDGKNFIFSGIKDEFTLALVEDDTKKGVYNTRVFRFSSSDHQWKSIPGLREDGSFKKGDEENKNHHYVQSAKLHKDVYKVINELEQLNDVDIDFEKFLPAKGKEYENEDKFKENYATFNDSKWESSQLMCQTFYNFYSYLVTKSSHREDFSLDGGLYKSLKNLEIFCKKNKFSFGENISNLIKDMEEMNADPKNAEELQKISMKELKRNFHKKEGANENHKKLLSSYHSNVANFIEGVFKSRSKKIFPETMMPNFSKDNCIDKYAKDNINIEEYKVKSESGDELVFAMAYDEKGRVYIDNIYNPNSKVSSYGTLDEITQMGHLVYKPEDYDEQATIGFPNNYREIIDFTSYSDISKLWENIPVIKRFKNELISRGDIKKEEESAKEDGSVEKTTKDEGVDERDKGVDKKTDKPIFDRVKDRVFKSEESEEPKKEKDKESKKGEGDPETVETVEETPEIEIENTEEEGEGVNEEILRALEDINVSIEDMKKINGFEALSPGAQLLAINNYKQIIDDDAVKEGLEKINKRKRLKKEQYQEKYGKRKGSILSGITSIFGGAKRKEAAYKESLTDIKDKDFDSKRFALEASVNWVTGADISAEIKEGKIEFNFINKAEVDEEAHEIVDELNSIATKFAKMPQYFSNISAKKRDKRNYEKIKEELENKKTELVEVLKGKESESKIINQLNKLNFKITNLQNNLTDEEINELEKSNSKFLNLFKSKKAEKGYYFIGGLVARAGIKKKFGEKASEEALEAGLGAGATALASYGTLGIAAAIGGIRGWRKAEKSIREDDKMIGKKEETEIMKIRREKLKALREANPENADQAQKEFDEANKNFLKEQMRNKTEANFLFASKANDKIEKLVGNIRDLNSKENLNEEEKNKLNQLRESLKSRIKYTRDKIDNGLIALGSGANRLVNSSNLFNSITQAEVLMEGLDYSEFRESSKKEDYNPDKSIDRRIEILLSENLSDFIPDEFIDKKGKIDIVAWLNQASPEEKSAYRQRKIEGYLKSRSKKIDIKRRNYKIKKAAIGAVSGAALAYTGMKSFDALSQTEAGQFIGEKISDSLKWGVDQGQGAVNYLKETLGGVESLEKVIPSVDDVDIASDSASEVFSESSSEVGGENISEVDVINEASRVEGIESSESYGEAISTEEGVGEGVGEEVEEVISTEEGVGEGTEEGVEEVVDKEADSAYIPTSFEELEKADLLTKVVSNENLKPGQTDSVWRSLRSIFMDNAEDLGYKGDMDDAASLRSWADNQTANTINTTVEKTGELKDLIHEGNKVSLLKDEDGDMIFDVEKADGRFEPSTLPKKEPIIEQEFKIPEEMESRPISGIETKRPSIPGLESVEEVINEGDSLVNEELTTQAGGVAEEIPKTVEEIPKKESNYDEMASLVDSIGEEDGLKSDVEQTYEKWADSIEKQGAEEITDNTVSDQVESDIPGEQLDSEGKVDESTFLGDDLDQGTEEVVKEVPDEPAEQEDINEVLGTKTAESMFDSSSVSQKTYEIQKYLISNRNVIPKEALEDLENTFIVGGRETIFGNIRGGTETSLASELNKIMGIEDFYQNLNEIHQLGFRSVINDIIDGNPNSQRLAINRLSKLISSIN